MSRFILPSLLILTAAIVAIKMAREPDVASSRLSETGPVSTRAASSHSPDRNNSARISPGNTLAVLLDASCSPLSQSPFSSSFSHAVPGRAASTPPDVPYLTPQPAAWIDLGLPQSMLGSNFDQRMLALAQDVVAQTSDSTLADHESGSPLGGDSPASDESVAGSIPIPATSHPNWANAVAESDLRFRQLYGGHLWMRHHLQSHHLAAGNLPSEN